MLESKAAQIRLNTLTAIHKADRGCTGACMSVVEILTALYYGNINDKPVVNFDVNKPGWDAQDYVILSKNGTAVTQYAILADLGFFDKSELDYLGQPGALLTDYPMAKVPGIAATILDEGYGLSIAVGIALSLKMERKSNKVFVILGDGELQKGQIWEAAAIASYYKLDNLIVLIDNAKFEIEPTVLSTPKTINIQDKFESFGWKVTQVTDGHDFDKILDGIHKAMNTLRVPICVWCHTIAGKGVAFAERKEGYLKTVLSENELSEVIPKLQALV